MRVKALTLWQPWASLVAIGAKKYETRSWHTTYRGWLAIHAAKREPVLPGGEVQELMAQELEAVGLSFDTLPRGMVVAASYLADCFPVEEVWAKLSSLGNEQAFGDFGAGRFAWELTDVKIVEPPIPAKGKQGLWVWEVEL